jgi:hypothetical protein
MYVQIDAERLRQLVIESADYHALLAAGVDNWTGRDSVEWPTRDDIDYLCNDVMLNLWQNVPPQEHVAKVLLRRAEQDQEYEYMLCSWVENSEGVLWLVDSEYNAYVPFDPGDQWMKLEDEVPTNV